jgi:proline iminopeptidase
MTTLDRLRPAAPLTLTLALALVPACLDPGEPGNLVPGTVDDDPSLPRVELNGTVLHAEDFGPAGAPMIVAMHSGPGGDYRQHLPYAALADDGYHVVFWDQRGSGLSRRHDASDYSLEVYLEDLRLVIEEFSAGDEPIVFLGQSWGAMYATWFISEHGDYDGRIAGAVLSEPGAFTSEGLEDYIAEGFPPWSIVSEELNDVLWSEQVMSPADHERADYLQTVAILAEFPREHNDPDNPAPRWRQGAVVNSEVVEIALDEGFDWTVGLDRFAPEVLFLRGELNENMPLAHQQERASHFGASRVVTIMGAGHEALWEKSAECLSLIRAYLSEVLP